MKQDSNNLKVNSFSATGFAYGKLYLAGEYAVTMSGGLAVIKATNLGISVEARQPYTDIAEIISGEKRLNYHFDKKLKEIRSSDADSKYFQYVWSAMNLVFQYIKGQGVEPRAVNLIIRSQLDSTDRRKYGLGSSGAVMVATIKALLSFWRIKVSDLTIYKLASLASLKLGSEGSLGDIAAASFGGTIFYQSADRQLIKKRMDSLAINELLNEEWPDLIIEPIISSPKLKFLVGWTGAPADSAVMLQSVKKYFQINPLELLNFKERSNQLVRTFRKGLEQGDFTKTKQVVDKLANTLKDLGAKSGAKIETTRLKKLIEIAKICGYAGKSSGAGGGDCGIAIGKAEADEVRLVELWKESDIKNLKI